MTAATGPAPPTGSIAVLGVGVIAAALMLVDTGARPEETSGALVVVCVLVAVTAPFLGRLARHDGDRWLAGLLAVALVLKLVAALVLYVVSFDLYEGVADAALYAERAAGLAPQLRAGNLGIDVGLPVPGTGFPILLTTIVYAVIGSNRLGAFFVFSWMGFVGLVLFQRAFRLALPDGDLRRYSALLLLLPSLLFWPATIGKESWIMLVLGLSAYGAARVLTGRRGGYLTLALGVAGMALVRPHMSLLLVGAVTVGFLRRRAQRPDAPGRTVQVAGLVVLIVAASLLVRETERFFAVEGAGVAGATAVLDKTAANTAIGGSEFEARPVRSPADVPVALVNVLFRPFPTEAHNAPALLASLEGAGLLLLVLASRSRLARLPRAAWRQPYVALATTFVFAFAVAFSNFANFGLLARQRVQVFPFALVLLALPPVVASRGRPLRRW